MAQPHLPWNTWMPAPPFPFANPLPVGEPVTVPRLSNAVASDATNLPQLVTQHHPPFQYQRPGFVPHASQVSPTVPPTLGYQPLLTPCWNPPHPQQTFASPRLANTSHQTDAFHQTQYLHPPQATMIGQAPPRAISHSGIRNVQFTIPPQHPDVKVVVEKLAHDIGELNMIVSSYEHQNQRRQSPAISSHGTRQAPQHWSQNQGHGSTIPGEYQRRKNGIGQPGFFSDCSLGHVIEGNRQTPGIFVEESQGENKQDTGSNIEQRGGKDNSHWTSPKINQSNSNNHCLNNQATSTPGWVDNNGQQEQGNNGQPNDDWVSQNSDQQNNDWASKKSDQQSNDWENNDNDDQQNNGWDDNNASSKPKTKKSKRPKYVEVAEQKGSKPAEPSYTRSYWMNSESANYLGNPNSNSGKRQDRHTIPEEPVYTISDAIAKEAHVRHQVRGGVGIECVKQTYKPVYWDNFEKPYAVFRFHYRSRGMFTFDLVFPRSALRLQ
jgi:hypothetical protein